MRLPPFCVEVILYLALPDTMCTEADTIRILVATDNHVGFEERDAIRKDDSWQSFDEVLNIARTEDVSDSTTLPLVPSAHGACQL